MNKNIVWKLFEGIITSVLAIVLAIMLFFTISSKISGGTPKVFGCQLLTVLSGSMEPKIHTGSIIAVKPEVNPENLEVGQVVTYKSLDDGNMLITHRIVEVQKSAGQVFYKTKGDSNDAVDIKPVPSTNVVGQYMNLSIPLLGYLFSFMKTKLGIVLFMIIPGVLLILWQVITIMLTAMRTEDKLKMTDENISSVQVENKQV